jgi:uroporphyrinogen decarboxylase
MSPDLFRKYLKPRFTYMISEFRKLNPDIKIAYHTCGNPSLVLDDIIEMGVDIYHSIQPRAIDPLEVKKRYGKRLSLWGGIDIQRILPFAKPEEVKAEVKRLVEGCGKDGGYIVAPAHHLQMDTPLENVLAFYEAAKEHGSYKN